MIMNKVIAILVAFFSVFCAYAQKAEKSEQYRVRITKVDGTTLEGYSMTSFYNTMLPEVKKFTFSTEYKGETTTYTSEEVGTSPARGITPVEHVVLYARTESSCRPCVVNGWRVHAVGERHAFRFHRFRVQAADT
jgi:ribonucleotide reductase alpha subunit